MRCTVDAALIWKESGLELKEPVQGGGLTGWIWEVGPSAIAILCHCGLKNLVDLRCPIRFIEVLFEETGYILVSARRDFLEYSSVDICTRLLASLP